MRRLFIALMALMLLGSIAQAQTVVNLSAVDTPDNQAWANGTWSVKLIPAAGNLSQTGNFTLTGAGSLASQSGSLSATGTASMALPATANIAPSSQWQFTVCPQPVNNAACFQQSVTVSTSSPQTLALTPSSIRINLATATPPVSAYATGEISAAVMGSQFFLIGTGIQVCSAISSNSCTTWSSPGLPAPNGSNLAVPGPPVFNVKNYGAKGDAQVSVNGSINSSTTLTCSDCNFSTARDVGKSAFCSVTGSTEGLAPNTTIASVTNSTTVILNNTATATNSCLLRWGTIDDTAITTAAAAATAASRGDPSAPLANSFLGTSSSSPTIYFPTGGYLVCAFGTQGSIALNNSGKSGVVVLGDGPQQSMLIAGGGTQCPTTNNNNGMLMTVFQALAVVRNISFHGGSQQGTAQAPAIACNSGCGIQFENVTVQAWGGGGGAGLSANGGRIYMDNFTVAGSAGIGISCNACQGYWKSGGSSNNGNSDNLSIANVVGLNTGQGFRIGPGVLIDECGSSTECTLVSNSNDVWFLGAALFGTPAGNCLHVTANSFVHWSGGICGVFGTDNNTPGPLIDAGSVLQSSDVRMVSTGTGKCITNSGQFNDNGGNSCESMFKIASGTSTGTAAVLTLTTAGANVNTNCSVGDALMVQGATIAGYNGYYPAGATSGITATSATTLSYTTSGSNLGALTSGGTAFCRNLQQFSGNLPKALLNNPIPNTCYITGTFAATTAAAPMCAFKLGSATNITAIKATSTTTTACTVAPVVTISDGTVSETLTITTAKSIWDSSVDTSTGVGTTIFKPNGTITLSNTVGTCTTPPTNFSVSYNISPILSN